MALEKTNVSSCNGNGRPFNCFEEVFPNILASLHSMYLLQPNNGTNYPPHRFRCLPLLVLLCCSPNDLLRIEQKAFLFFTLIFLFLLSCHCHAIGQGCSIRNVVAERFGQETTNQKIKQGLMLEPRKTKRIIEKRKSERENIASSQVFCCSLQS